MTEPYSRGELVIALTTTPTPDPEVQWIHVLPTGTFAPRDGRGPWTVADPDAVIAASRTYAGPRQIPVDYEHQTLNAPKNGQPAPAAGWIDALQVRPTGIWGRVRWTRRAASLLAGREYRYFSPVVALDREDRVRAILNGALTNTPALPQLLAVARAEIPTMNPDTQNGAPDAFLTELRNVLGLPDTADQAAVLSAVRDLVARTTASATIDPTKFVPIGTLEAAVAEVNRLSHGVSEQIALAHVDHQVRAGNLPPALKDWGVALCKVDKVAFDAFVEKTRGGFNAIVDPMKHAGRIATARAGRGDQLTDDERAVCRRMGVGEDDFLKARAFTETGKA